MAGIMALSLFYRLIWVLMVTYRCNASAGLNDDVLGLIVFKVGLQDPTLALDSWNEDDDSPCSWKYVECSPKNGRVTGVVLEGLSLSGRIGKGLERVEYLQELSLANNNFSGSISQDVALIGGLRRLNLSHNVLSGSIPAVLGTGISLVSLDVSNNRLSGSIPDELFGRCGSLRFVSVAGNLLGGHLPKGLARCASLKGLNFSANRLSGSIPGGIWALGKLRALGLSHNSFVGAVPVGIGRLNNLRELHLQKNGFSGPLPSDIGGCAWLTSLDLGQNMFSGSLPESLQRLNLLSSLSFQGNLLMGTIPSWIGNLTSIEYMDLSSNNFTGSLPDSLGLLQSLTFLNISNNALAGTIPASLLECSKLSSIDLSGNALTGSIPQELFALGLENVDLSSNNLSGIIPSGSSHLYESLRVLDLSHNMLTGEVPFQMSLCFKLSVLNLSANFLESRIPPEFGDFRFMTTLDLSHNRLYGSIPGSLFDSSSLSVLQLDGNLLSGEIPADVGSCSSLNLLSLSHNSLSGPIPEEVAKLQNIVILSLSNNNLTGQLPPELGNLAHLLEFNVSYNRLEGRIPTGGVFQRIDQSAFDGNAGLCGMTVPESCQMSVPKPLVVNPNASNGSNGGMSGLIISKHRKIVLSVSAIIAISAAAVIALGVVAVTLLNIRVQHQPRLMNPDVENFSMPFSTELVSEKLVMFSPNSKPGSEQWVNSVHALLTKDSELGKGGFGTVYKTVIGDGRVVAIKKLMVSNLVTAQQDFEKEVQVLGKLKHPNLVSLRGYYWTPQLQLLIYDYVPNGSLYSRLHENPPHVPSLSWQERFNIALGAARGLAHLHQACRPPIIHYNLKSSNVLLDEDLNPRISDYGLAKLLPVLDRYILSRKFQGALGYVAPEFACQSLRINEKCDIYGFGVLILELVTGRRPVEYMEDDVVILCDYVRSLLDEGTALSAVDPSLHEYSEDEVMPVIKLGLICTSQVPSSRPSMAEVVQILEVIKTPMGSRELL